jgi:ribonuclease P protein component
MNSPSQAAPRPASPRSLASLRLRKHADYQRAYAASRKRQSVSMSWFLAPQSPPAVGAPLPSTPRVGLTAGKVMGKAHERNRLKRRMREALRLHTDLFPVGCDLIFHPRRSVLTLDFAKLEAEIVRILQQARSEAARMKPNTVNLAISSQVPGAQSKAPTAPQVPPQVLPS